MRRPSLPLGTPLSVGVFCCALLLTPKLWIGQGAVELPAAVPSALAKSAAGKTAKSAAAGKAPKSAPAAKAAQSAAALLEAGVTALRLHDFVTAAQNLSAAYRSEPTPDALYQLGALAVAQDQVLEAQDYFRRYLVDAPGEQATEAERSREIQRVLALPRPPSGEAVVLGPRGALVFVDDRLAGSLPLPLPLLLSTGNHTLVVETRAGRTTSALVVRLGRTHELRWSRDNSVVLARLLPAMLVLTELGSTPAALSAPLSATIERSLQREQLASFPAALALSSAPRLADCLAKSCPSELAAPQGVQHLLVVRAGTKAGDSPNALQLRLELHDTEVGDLALAVEKTCEGCTPEKAAATLSEALSMILSTGMTRPRGTLVVRSTPEDAEVRIGERLVGRTPLQRVAWPGVANISLRKPGFVESKSTTWVEDGKTATVELSLAEEAKKPAPAPAPLALSKAPAVPESIVMPRPRWRLITGGISIGAGVILTAFGSSALAVNKTCIMPTTMGECAELYRTDGIGGGLVGAGSVLVVLGVTLVAVPGPRRVITPAAPAELGGRVQ